MTIGEVAGQGRIAASAIRFYEREGLLPAPARINGRRQYDRSVFKRLAVIRLAQEAGFTISEIRTLMSGFAPTTPPSARWKALAGRKVHEVDALIARAQEMKAVLEEGLACGCLRIEDCEVLLRHDADASDPSAQK